MNPAIFNACLTIDNILPNMILPAIIESKEEKGYMLSFGTSDSCDGFMKFVGAEEEEGEEAKNPETEKAGDKKKQRKGVNYQEGALINVIVLSVNKQAKMITCERISLKDNKDKLGTLPLKYDPTITIESIKPGILVHAKITKILINGLYVNFLKGLEGTVFIDHLAHPLEEYKQRDKIALRIISVDLSSKAISLSEKQHIVMLSPVRPTSLPLEIGTHLNAATISTTAYGGSYFVMTEHDNNKMIMLLHVKKIYLFICSNI